MKTITVLLCTSLIIDSLGTKLLFILAGLALLMWLIIFISDPYEPPVTGDNPIADEVAAEQGFDLSTLDRLDGHKDQDFDRNFNLEL